MIRSLFCLALLTQGVLAELSKDEASRLVTETFQELAKTKELKMGESRDGFRPFMVEAADEKMRCIGKLYGEAPEGERSLFIAMHGGGGTTKEVNDRQWINMVQLYVPEEGWYVAPRAPLNTWKLWHEDHIDPLFSNMIEEMVANYGVDPEKVYLIGYSAGGDGVFRLGPRMADRFAAATMCAGHPGGVSAVGLKNLPFRIYMGGQDKAYKRNEHAAKWKVKLADLQKERGGYEHKVTIYPEDGHWMDKKDAEAIPWMATKTRNSWPKEVIWGKSGVRSERFYWVQGEPKGVFEAKVEGQVITLKGLWDSEMTLLLSDELVDLDQPIKVMADGQEVFEGKVERTKEAIVDSLKSRLDVSMAATASLKVKGEVAPPEPAKKEKPTVKKELAAKKEEPVVKQEELAAKQEELAAKQEELAAKQEELAAKQEELAAKQKELAAKQKELAAKQKELATKKEESTPKKESVE